MEKAKIKISSLAHLIIADPHIEVRFTYVFNFFFWTARLRRGQQNIHNWKNLKRWEVSETQIMYYYGVWKLWSFFWDDLLKYLKNFLTFFHLSLIGNEISSKLWNAWKIFLKLQVHKLKELHLLCTDRNIFPLACEAVIKLATVSLAEVFVDIIPGYVIR